MKSESTHLGQDSPNRTVVALAGGVGGAKLSHGLAAVLPEAGLTVIVNTADDFDHLGLRMCTDLDTVLYTLSNRENPVTGWGIDGDTRVTLDALAEYGQDPWFMVGDHDFATHIFRTERLQAGETLTQVTARLATASGLSSTLIPMTNDRVATLIETAEGRLDFQDYFVARRQQDVVLGVRFDGIAHASPAPGVIEAIADSDVVVIAPSNPVVSIGPILAVEGVGQALETTSALRIGVSPIIGGKALKGPADRMLASLGHEVSSLGVARIYEGLLDWFVIDDADNDLAPQIEALGMAVLITDTIMSDRGKRATLARSILDVKWPTS
ncbi:MAG: 2-phospho-L-lactate transferase [Thermomicrobiales bacterium]